MSHEPEPEVCELCGGTGYTPPRPRRFKSDSGKLVPCKAVWFCDCTRGRTQEAGYWFRVCFPEREKGNRVQSLGGEAALREYLTANPLQRRWLNDAIEACRQRYMAEKKRAVEARQEDD